MPADPRPKRFPPPQFPPHKPKLFASTPPAIFPPILGLMGLVLALRQAAQVTGLPGDPVELLSGAVLGLWAFAVVAIKVKGWRRLAVLGEDMRPLPGRAGLAAASMTGMAAGALIAPFSVPVALVLLWGSLLAHAVMGGWLIRTLAGLPPEARDVNPTLHLSFVGFIVAAAPLARLGFTASATVIFWATGAAAVAIWALSVVQLIRRIPPAPLRPLLAIHAAPAALLSATAAVLGMGRLSEALALLALAIAVALAASLRWLVESGFSPMWGAFTFPLAALATALMLQGGWLSWVGLAVVALAAAVNLTVGWKVLKLWPGNRLAQKTGAAEA